MQGSTAKIRQGTTVRACTKVRWTKAWH